MDAQDVGEGEISTYAQAIEAEGGLDKIAELQNHPQRVYYVH